MQRPPVPMRPTRIRSFAPSARRLASSVPATAVVTNCLRFTGVKYHKEMRPARWAGAGVMPGKERNWYGMQIVLTMALLAAGAADGVVLQPVANMYARPSEEADVGSQAIYGSHIGIIEERGGWARVRTADEYTGWIPASVFKRLWHGG